MIPVESAAKDPSAIRTSILGDRWIADFHALISVSRPGKKQTKALKIKIPNSIPSIDSQVLPEIMWIPIQIIAGIVKPHAIFIWEKAVSTFSSIFTCRSRSTSDPSNSTPYPVFSTAERRLAESTEPEIVAFSKVRFTIASSTPSTFRKAPSTEPTHPAQCIPDIFNSIISFIKFV